jgi:hypothetical protein
MFSNSSPSYANLTVVDGGGSSDDGISIGVIIALVAGVVIVVAAAGYFVNRSRATADDRE